MFIKETVLWNRKTPTRPDWEERTMAKYRRLWFLLIGILAVTFTLLGYFGAEVYREHRPFRTCCVRRRRHPDDRGKHS